MLWDKPAFLKWKAYLVAIIAVLVAVVVRMELLGALGARVLYVTFYPAVMAASLYGGFKGGLLATLLSALFASMWWLEPVGNPFIVSNPIDLLGMTVFIVCSSMIAYLCEVTHRARTRAKEVEARARVATERDKMADALVKSSDRLRLAMESTQLGMYDYDLITHTFECSEHCKAFFGLPMAAQVDREILLGRLDPADQRRIQELIAQALCPTAIGRSHGAELRLRWPDGTEHWIAASARVIFQDLDGEHRPLRIIGTVLDITERRRAEEERLRLLMMLEQRSAEMEAVFAGMTDAVLIYDTSMTVVRVNPAFIPTYGFDPIGLNVRDMIERTQCRYVDGRPFRFEDQPTPRAVRGERVQNQRYVITRPDGMEMAVETSSGPLCVGGEVIGSVTVWHDITERRKSEEQLRELSQRLTYHVENSPLAVIEWGPDMRLIRWSGEAERMFGWTAEEVLGKRMEDFRWIYDEDIPRVRSVSSHLKDGSQPANVSANRNYRKDGSIVDSEWYNSSLVDESGKVRSILSLVLDVTYRNQAERALHDSEARFRLLSESAGRLLLTEEPQAVVNEICSRVMDFLDCQVFFNFLVDEQVGRLRLNACAGISEEEAGKIEWLDYGVAVCGCAARDSIRIVAEDIFNTPDARTELVKSYGIQAYACHPLLVEGRSLGTLSFGTRSRSHFSQEDLSLMKTVTDQVAVSMERVRLIQELQRAKEDLEMRVRERTGQLTQANQILEIEIQERTSVENSLREKNDLLECILSTVHFLIAFLDRDFNFVRVNEAYARAGAYSPDFLVGKNHFDLYPDGDNKEIFQQVVKTGLPYFATEKPFEYKDHPEWGITYWDWSLHPVKDESGDVTGLVFTLLDRTDRRRAQDALRENEELLEKVLDTLPVGVWITDQNGRITKANPAAVRIWGGERKVDPAHYGEYKGWWGDSGKPIEAEDWALARAFTRGEESINEIIDIRCFDGSRKTILNSAFPIYNDRHEIARAIVVNQDITELRQVESELRESEKRLQKNLELLQTVLDGITEPLVMLDENGLVKMINKAAICYYGVPPAGDILGKPCFEGLRGRETVCPGCDYPFPEAVSETLTLERRGLQDARKVENLTLYPVVGESGRREAVIVRISDITQAKLLERQILQNEKLASLGLVSSGIAHEINNPNSFIFFNIPILRKYLEELLPIVDEYADDHADFEVLHMPYRELREDIFKLLENMEHGSQRINKIVGVLKSFVRKRDSQGLQQIDLKQLIDKVLSLCRAEIRRTVQSFEVLIPEDLPSIVSDTEALEQILMNLLINAVHACDKPASQVRLKVEQDTAFENGIVIEISDNGSGIEEELRQKIFDPFFTTKPSTLGTGLGLYICYNHVQSLGGSIEVESTVGQGSTFRIALPLIDKNGMAGERSKTVLPDKSEARQSMKELP